MATDSVIEVQRKLHEERERIEDAIAKEMLLRKSNVSSPPLPRDTSDCVLVVQVREQINSEHRMRDLVERSLTSAQRLSDVYNDRDG